MFKAEGNLPVSIQDAIKTAITGIKTVGPEVIKNIAQIVKQTEKQTEEAKETFFEAINKEKIKKYVSENPVDVTVDVGYIAKVSKDLNVSIREIEETLHEMLEKKEEKKE